MSEDTPASIKTSRPNPEPVPALPGSLSAIVVIVCEVDMAMRSAAATAAVVSLRRLLLLHLPRVLFLHAPVQYPAGCVVNYSAVVLLFWSKRQGPLCDLGSFIPAVLLHWRDRTSSGESSAGSETDTHHRHTQRHIHASSASCDAFHILMLVISESYILI